MAFLTIFISLFFLSLPLPSTQDLNADRTALISLRSAVKGRTFRWNIKQTSPCNWAGVKCENNNRVTALHLPGVSLTGHIPEGIFGNLTQLRTLSLRLNALSGSLPKDLSTSSNLKHLYLQGNRFSGDIPEALFSLTNLVRLNLASNSFTGEFSSSFANLTRLNTLFLENNKLSGSIPDLDLPLLQFNVSNNSFNGSIPKNFQKFTSDSFLQTLLCGKPLKLCPNQETVPSQPTFGGNRTPPPGDEDKKKKNKLSGGAIAGIVIGCVVGFALIVLILVVVCRKKSNEVSRAIDISTITQEEEGNSVSAAAAAAMTANGKAKEVNGLATKKLVFFGNATKVFDLEDLLRASAEVLGKGTFGTAYKAVLDEVTAVAVKRLKDVMMVDQDFKEKIELIGAMDHQNLVPLRAYYFSGDEKLLVYDFMPMGSLSALLHGNRGARRSPLNWDVRSRIAIGTARGLEYLHSQGTTITSHGNIKSSNILLTKSLNAKVSDFGLSQLVGTSPNRATGYSAPEVTDLKRVSQKGDVYSFGVVLLELITGKAPSNSVMNEEGVDLPRWVRSVSRDEWRREVFDSELLCLAAEEEEMMEEMVQIGLECTSQHPDKRPEMSEVVRKMENLRPGSDQVDEAV